MSTEKTSVVVLAEPKNNFFLHLVASNCSPILAGHSIGLHRACTDDELAVAPKDTRIIYSCFGGKEFLHSALAHLPNVEWVHSHFAGVGHLLYPEFVQSNIVLTNTRGAYGSSLAEFVLAAILYFEKEFTTLQRNKLARRWSPFAMQELRGKEAVIVGYGDIGHEVAKRLVAMEVNITAVKKQVSATADVYARHIVAIESLKEVLPGADYVVLALPATAATTNLIDRAAIECMKHGTILVNVGRGSTLDEHTAIEYLKRQHIRAAALDVFAEEPLPSDHPFFELDNVLVSPHCADRVPNWEDQPVQIFVDNLSRFLDQKPLNYVVDKSAGY